MEIVKPKVAFKIAEVLRANDRGISLAKIAAESEVRVNTVVDYLMLLIRHDLVRRLDAKNSKFQFTREGKIAYDNVIHGADL